VEAKVCAGESADQKEQEPSYRAELREVRTLADAAHRAVAANPRIAKPRDEMGGTS
jgi:hypothetical protein